MEFIDIFEENCKKYPEVPALKSVLNNQSVTYGELNLYSASVYAYLKKKGIGREQMVLVHLPRDTRMVVAIIGIIKAGAAFTLCEDTYPKDRVEFIKKDCNCVWTINEVSFEEMMAEPPLYGHELTNPHDACFAVYTSGSTGNPKGVLHEYGKLMQIADSICKISPELPVSSVHALSAPFTFVASIILVLRTMSKALCLYILSYEIAKDVSKLAKFIEDNDVREAFLSLGVLRIYKNNMYKGLVNIFSGGEAYNKFCLPEGICFNGTYCSSESAFLLATFRIDKEYDKTPAGKNSIGVEIFILDENGKKLPDGEIGEICFKNEFTRGYINLPKKTAEAFAHGYYHMGDLGYINEDGNLMICGRKDDMIKIDGNRIEPAEIEAAIKNELGISNVVAKGFVEDDRSFICAYFLENELREKNLLKEDGSFDTQKSKLRKTLPNRLPYYMFPTYYCVLPTYPVNANGKLDKKQLTAPDISSYTREYVAPANELEEKLCNVMADILGQKVGATDDFYEIGGNSMSAIKLIYQMNLSTLDINMLLTKRTPREIAEVCLALMSEGAEESLDERNAKALAKDLPLSAEQTFMFDYQCYYPDSTVWNLPLLLKFGRDTDMERLKKALDTVLKVHPVFSIMYRFNKKAEIVQKYEADKIFDTELEEISEANFIDESEKLVQPFVLLNNPLYRVRLFKTEMGGYLFFDLHHSIADGTSFHLLIDDISKAYDGKPLEDDYYFLVMEDRAKQVDASLYEEARQYYERTLQQKKWDICLTPDLETKENSYGNMTVMLPLDGQSYGELQEKYGIGKNAFYIAVACVAIAAYNGTKDIRVSWVHNGRTNLRENHVIGALLRDLYVGISFEDNLTIGELYKEVVSQVNNDIRYACYPYPGPEHFCEESDDASVLYQANLRDICAGGTLKFTEAEIPTETDCADNLLDIEILETDEGCKLYMDYNASAYKEESIYRFRKIFTKAACILMENTDKPETEISEIMEKIRC